MWTGSPWLGFDTETTGVDATSAHILTAALISYDPSEQHVVDKDNTIINPGVPIPEASIKVHGLTQEFIDANGVNPDKGLDHIASTIAQAVNNNHVLVAFNATYDFTILDANLEHHGLAKLHERCDLHQLLVVDPLVLDRKLNKYRRGKRRLVDLIAAYQVQIPDGDLHDAENDTVATLYLLRQMVDNYPELKEMAPRDLMAWQRSAHYEWAESFRAFMHSKGRQISLDSNWLGLEGID